MFGESSHTAAHGGSTVPPVPPHIVSAPNLNEIVENSKKLGVSTLGTCFGKVIVDHTDGATMWSIMAGVTHSAVARSSFETTCVGRNALPHPGGILSSTAATAATDPIV